MEQSIITKLLNIQQELKCPKGQEGTGADGRGFKYRNLADIQQAIKPLLKKHQLVIVFTDIVEEIGGCRYTHSVARLLDANGNSVEGHGWAREEDDPSDMSVAQMSGACSSYARKYAAAGLLAIDDSLSSQSHVEIDARQPQGRRKDPEPAPQEKTPVVKDGPVWLALVTKQKTFKGGEKAYRKTITDNYQCDQETFDALIEIFKNRKK